MDKTIYYPYENDVLDVEDIHQIKQVLFGHKQVTSLPSTVTGSATGGSDVTLIDTGANFTGDGIVVGDAVYNSSDDSYAIVKVVNSATQLTITKLVGGTLNTFSAGNTYQLKTVANQIIILTTIDGSNVAGIYKRNTANTIWSILGGDVKGPISSVNKSVPLMDGVTGRLLQNSELMYDQNNHRIWRNGFLNSYIELAGDLVRLRANNEYFLAGSATQSALLNPSLVRSAIINGNIKIDTTNAGTQLGNTGARVTHIQPSTDATPANDTTIPTTKWVEDNISGKDAFSISNSGTQVFSSGTSVIPTFDTEDLDSGSFVNLAVNNDRFTIPVGKGGWYNIVFGFDTNAVADSGFKFKVFLLVNGSSQGEIGYFYDYDGANKESVFNFSKMLNLSDGDYVTFSVNRVDSNYRNIIKTYLQGFKVY